MSRTNAEMSEQRGRQQVSASEVSNSLQYQRNGSHEETHNVSAHALLSALMHRIIGWNAEIVMRGRIREAERLHKYEISVMRVTAEG